MQAKKLPLALTTLALLVGVMVSSAAVADNVGSIRLKIFFKIMTYDGNFPMEAAKVRIGFVYPRSMSADEIDAAHTLFGGFSETTIHGKPFELVDVPYETTAGLTASLRGKDLYAVFLAGSVPAGDGATIAAAATSEHLFSFAVDPTLVASGIGAAVEITDNRPRIVINATACKTAGRGLDSALLALARIVQ